MSSAPEDAFWSCKVLLFSYYIANFVLRAETAVFFNLPCLRREDVAHAAGARRRRASLDGVGARTKRRAALARIVRIRKQGADARRECVVMQESDPLAVRRLRLRKSQLQIGW